MVSVSIKILGPKLFGNPKMFGYLNYLWDLNLKKKNFGGLIFLGEVYFWRRFGGKTWGKDIFHASFHFKISWILSTDPDGCNARARQIIPDICCSFHGWPVIRSMLTRSYATNSIHQVTCTQCPIKMWLSQVAPGKKVTFFMGHCVFCTIMFLLPKFFSCVLFWAWRLTDENQSGLPHY